ncbi:Oidioi.mRNA.OKI2018_I69.PAR.g13176.t1.cds [Oikopleura dioica]|uniref:Oidioi.mRNA.OKI2018_I69.PAR.g13176.t1.cds n=1 Tax=Oikopleura dioica TaxID=34765 RepID=A0ABN7S6N2_OIKDI|nr:Oidioi.mRNA.OKI2018_I69.PAR.g13176.t1.cds [Oikopleura dioica]
MATNLSATVVDTTVVTTTTATAPTFENVQERYNVNLTDLACSCSCAKDSVIIFNMSISDATSPVVDPVPEKPEFDYMNTFLWVMLPSLLTFFLLTFGFYILAGYTSGTQMEDLKKKFKQKKIDKKTEPMGIIHIFKERGGEPQEQAPPNYNVEKGQIETIVEEKSDETKFNSPCLTDQREDAFYKDRTSEN